MTARPVCLWVTNDWGARRSAREREAGKAGAKGQSERISTRRRRKEREKQNNILIILRGTNRTVIFYCINLRRKKKKKMRER